MITETLLTPEAPRIDRHYLPGRQTEIGRQQPATSFAVTLLAVHHHLQRMPLRLVIDHLAQLETLPDLQPVITQLAAIAADFHKRIHLDADELGESVLVDVLQ